MFEYKNYNTYDMVLDDILISVLNIGLLVLPAVILYNFNKMLRNKDNVNDNLNENSDLLDDESAEMNDLSDLETETCDSDTIDDDMDIDNENDNVLENDNCKCECDCEDGVSEKLNTLEISETEMNNKIRNILDDLSAFNMNSTK